MQMRTHAYKHTCVQGEEGIDAGGVSREWYAVMAQEIFNPNLALFVQVCVCVCVCVPSRQLPSAPLASTSHALCLGLLWGIRCWHRASFSLAL